MTSEGDQDAFATTFVLEESVDLRSKTCLNVCSKHGDGLNTSGFYFLY